MSDVCILFHLANQQFFFIAFSECVSLKKKKEATALNYELYEEFLLKQKQLSNSKPRGCHLIIKLVVS